MHSKDLRAAGESEERLYLLDAWREAPFYSDRERAALAWAEAVTLISKEHVPDNIYEQARQQFTDDEVVKLTLAVVAINGWNRFGIAFRAITWKVSAEPPSRDCDGVTTGNCDLVGTTVSIRSQSASSFQVRQFFTLQQQPDRPRLTLGSLLMKPCFSSFTTISCTAGGVTWK